MKKFIQTKSHFVESGQMIPIVVLFLLAILGMVVLIIDGGGVMSNRRTAQAAADSGALAGAKRVCTGYGDAKTVAESYAVGNGATTAYASVSGYEVTVQVTVENPSFFARIFGENILVAGAQATAGCYGPRGTAAVPLAWYCRAPSVGGPYNLDYGCQIQTLSIDLIGPLIKGQVTSVTISDYYGNSKDYHMSGSNIVDETGLPPKQIYIVIDSDKVCLEEGGEIPCDLDGDGKKDIQLGGDRGWLYLTADTSNIADWIDAGPHPDITLQSHIWLSGKPGVATNVYDKMITSGFVGEIVLIPVYNVLCDGDPRVDSSCVDAAHASPPWPPFSGVDNFDEIRNTSLNYHILTFDPFYISCISKKGDCPGFRYAQTLPGGENLKDGAVIEGFFLSDYTISPDSRTGCDINLGNCQVSLSK